MHQNGLVETTDSVSSSAAVSATPATTNYCPLSRQIGSLCLYVGLQLKRPGAQEDKLISAEHTELGKQMGP